MFKKGDIIESTYNSGLDNMYVRMTFVKYDSVSKNRFTGVILEFRCKNKQYEDLFQVGELEANWPAGNFILVEDQSPKLEKAFNKALNKLEKKCSKQEI